MSDQQRPVLGGRYELYRRIARGGMAEVFLARDQLLDRPVAVKVLIPEFASDPNFVERFRREAQAAANLSHPHVVGVFDWGAERGTYYIVMEYVEGTSLAHLIRAEGPLDPERSAEIAAAIAGALGAAHAGGVVHRDVKPGNVLLDAGGSVKVTDFGIARAMTGPASDGLTQTGAVMGTASYLSPEQAQGHPADPRSDVYSLGVVLYEMLAARPPFAGDTPVAIAFKHVREEPVAPSQVVSTIPDELEAIVLHALAKKPEDRYSSAEELRGDLRRFLRGEPPTVAMAARGTSPSSPGPGGAAAAGAAGAAAGAAAGGGTPAAAASPPPPPVSPTTAMPPTPPAGPPPGYGAGGYGYGPPTGSQPPLPPEPQRNTGLFVGITIALLAILGVLIFFLAQALGGDGGDDGPDETEVTEREVPNVVGQSVVEAEETLRTLELEPVIQQTPSDEEAGTVVSQFPPAGSTVDVGDEITLQVSQGVALGRVPNVVDLEENAARAEIRDAGFVPSASREASEDVEEGTVIRQDPAPGAELEEGETVEIVISSGQDLFDLPPLEGLTDRQAEVELARLQLSSEFRREVDEDVEQGSVIRTEPAAGAQVARGDTIIVFVSDGPEVIEIEDFVGQSPVAARAVFERAGLEVRIEEVEVPNGSPDADTVLSMNPPAGASALPGDVITLRVGVEAPPETTTTTTTTTTTEAPPTTQGGGGGGDDG